MTYQPFSLVPYVSFSAFVQIFRQLNFYSWIWGYTFSPSLSPLLFKSQTNIIPFINKYFLLSKHIEQEKVDRWLGIKPGSIDYMPSVVPLDHQQSCFLMLFNSQLRVLHCPIYDLDNLDACALHAKYYGMHMCMCITLLLRRRPCACAPKWST